MGQPLIIVETKLDLCINAGSKLLSNFKPVTGSNGLAKDPAVLSDNEVVTRAPIRVFRKYEKSLLDRADLNNFQITDVVIHFTTSVLCFMTRINAAKPRRAGAALPKINARNKTQLNFSVADGGCVDGIVAASMIISLFSPSLNGILKMTAQLSFAK
jgi:hypothetical protein